MDEKNGAGWADLPVQVLAGVIVLVIGAIGAAIWTPTRGWLTGPVWFWGWGFAVAILAAFAAGVFLGWWLWRNTPRVRVEIAQFAKEVKPKPPAFTPTPFQEDVIRVLRLADDVWLSAKQVVNYLPPGTAVSDVDQAGRRLVEEGYAKDLLVAGEGRRFTLADRGLDHAQKKGLPAGSSAQKAAMKSTPPT